MRVRGERAQQGWCAVPADEGKAAAGAEIGVWGQTREEEEGMERCRGVRVGCREGKGKEREGKGRGGDG